MCDIRTVGLLCQCSLVSMWKSVVIIIVDVAFYIINIPLVYRCCTFILRSHIGTYCMNTLQLNSRTFMHNIAIYLQSILQLYAYFIEESLLNIVVWSCNKYQEYQTFEFTQLFKYVPLGVLLLKLFIRLKQCWPWPGCRVGRISGHLVQGRCEALWACRSSIFTKFTPILLNMCTVCPVWCSKGIESP